MTLRFYQGLVTERRSMAKKEIAEGVTRDESFNPVVDNKPIKAEKVPGAWVKVTREQMAKFEAAGVLIGYDYATGEALIK